VGVHVGTIPDDDNAPAWNTLLTRTRIVADELAGCGLTLLLETGREPVNVLLRFMGAVARENVGISFDPGNLIVYGVDDPVRAVSALRGRVSLVHLKDALRSAATGVAYGQRAELGMGDVQIPRVLSKLRATGYTGPILVEVSGDAGDLSQPIATVEFLRSMLK